MNSNINEDLKPTIATKTYNVCEAATALGCSEFTIRKLVKFGELKHIRLGKLIKIPVRAIDDLIENAHKGASPVISGWYSCT